jgi:hypothetical protein
MSVFVHAALMMGSARSDNNFSVQSIRHQREAHMKLHGISSQIRNASGLILMAALVAACDPGEPDTGAAKNGGGNVGGAAAPLSEAEYRSLSTDQQYLVVNKLMGTLYKGMPVSEFYDMSDGLMVSTPRDKSLTLNVLRKRLETELDVNELARLNTEIMGDPDARDDKGAPAPIEARFRFDQNKPKQMPLARIHTYPLSRNGFSQWMAWQLANTILFSPAEEIDSADITDVQNLFRRLDLSIMNRRGIREIVATHQRTVENWRRFRSPEDNTREMMEIYLGIFDNDAEVPNASKACQDLYLTDERDGYKLAYTDYPNNEPQLVLNKYVQNCNEFYDTIAAHPLLIPRVVSVLVDYFMAGQDAQTRLALVESIAAANPQTFDDIFLPILFSRNYLLDTERPKSFEESYLGMAERLRWKANSEVFMGMTGGRGRLSKADMSEMGWPAMSLKLGRVSGVPLDSLSFANYHKAMRETLMLDKNGWRRELNLERPDAPEPAPIDALPADASSREMAAYNAEIAEYNAAVADLNSVERQAYNLELADYEENYARYKEIEDLTLAELMDYLFLSAVQRRATEVERTDLATILDSIGYLDEEYSGAFVRSGRMDDSATVILDYLSRLPELYYQKRLN